MTARNWQRLGEEQYGEALDSWFDQLLAEPPPTDDQLDTERHRNWLDAVRQHDQGAHLEEELLVHLSGQAVEDGGLQFKLGEALMKPLQAGVTAASPKGDVELELTGISSGSCVMHVRPLPPTPAEQTDHLAGSTELDAPVDTSLSDVAVRALVDVVEAAEAQRDIRRWTALWHSLDRLVDTLDRYDLDIGLRWNASNGAVRSSSLTRSGRSYVRNLRGTEEQSSTREIHGRVTELRESGKVGVKTGASRTSTKFEVLFDPDQLLGMHFALGDQVGFVVDERRSVNRLGQNSSIEYVFVRLADEQIEMP